MIRLDCAGRRLELGRPAIMGILNITPDSFSDGGVYFSADAARAGAEAMVAAGADILDIGGESTRPGAASVPVQEELDRVIPVLEALRDTVEVPLSVDTSKPEVMRAAVAAGAGMINDVNALQAPGAMAAAAEAAVPVCLMHMQGQPRTMQQAPRYRDVVAEVRDFLRQRAEACRQAGIPAERIVIDPGFGFGKSLSHNLSLLKHLEVFRELGYPLLVGLSRKSMLGQILDAPVTERLYASLAVGLMAAMAGARIIRVHDVGETRQVLQVYQAVWQAD
jgi:dihydropteroate synthase